MIHTDISLIFGDARTSINPDSIRGKIFPVGKLPISHVIFQHQVHGNVGHVIDLDNLKDFNKSLTHDGDYLVTNIPGVALGVLTADCLPVALFDPVHRAVGMVHAGWRGTIAHVCARAVMHMSELYGTQPEDLVCYFGPCARSCCYEVDKLFLQNLPEWALKFSKKEGEKVFFDLCACNQKILARLGVCQKNTILKFCVCTICTGSFCSYRRNSGSPARQMSIIWIK